jgi:hypothetical protein
MLFDEPIIDTRTEKGSNKTYVHFCTIIHFWETQYKVGSEPHVKLDKYLIDMIRN